MTQPATRHGLAAWAPESNALRVVIVPGLGAKIVSLFDKRARYEWLVDPMRPLKPSLYGASFGEQDMSGWDEMSPTIDAREYPAPAAALEPSNGFYDILTLAYQNE